MLWSLELAWSVPTCSRLFPSCRPWQPSMVALFNQAMIQHGKGSPTLPPVVNVSINGDKGFAFVELRTPEVCVSRWMMSLVRMVWTFGVGEAWARGGCR
jgi:hypothetical protein